MNSHRTVVSTFASPHEPTLKPKACKRASAFSAQVTAFQDGFRIAPHKKNKINLCFVGSLVRFDPDKNEGQIIDSQKQMNTCIQHQLPGKFGSSGFRWASFRLGCFSA